MLAALSVEVPAASFDFFWNTCDINGDGLVGVMMWRHARGTRC